MLTFKSPAIVQYDTLFQLMEADSLEYLKKILKFTFYRCVDYYSHTYKK